MLFAGSDRVTRTKWTQGGRLDKAQTRKIRLSWLWHLYPLCNSLYPVRCTLIVRFPILIRFDSLTSGREPGHSMVLCTCLYTTSTSGTHPATKLFHMFGVIVVRMCISRTLWIDAICINQSDDVEKSQQVQLMRGIYATADHVLIWTGEEDEHSPPAFAALARFADSWRMTPP